MLAAKFTLKKAVVFAGFCGLAGMALGCGPKPIRIAAQLDESIINEWSAALPSAVPGARVEWVRADSAEVDLILAGTRAEFEARKERFLCEPGKAAPPSVDSRWVDPDGCFAAVRLSLYVIAYDTRAVNPRNLPERWKDLDLPKWHEKVAESTTPLEMGTAPLATVELSEVLRAQSRKVPVRALYPLDQTRIVEWPVAILQSTRYPKIARQVRNWFFTPAAQNSIIRAGHYSPVNGMAYPDGARSWTEVKRTLPQR